MNSSITILDLFCGDNFDLLFNSGFETTGKYVGFHNLFVYREGWLAPHLIDALNKTVRRGKLPTKENPVLSSKRKGKFMLSSVWVLFIKEDYKWCTPLSTPKIYQLAQKEDFTNGNLLLKNRVGRPCWSSNRLIKGLRRKDAK